LLLIFFSAPLLMPIPLVSLCRREPPPIETAVPSPHEQTSSRAPMPPSTLLATFSPGSCFFFPLLRLIPGGPNGFHYVPATMSFCKVAPDPATSLLSPFPTAFPFHASFQFSLLCPLSTVCPLEGPLPPTMFFLISFSCFSRPPF